MVISARWFLDFKGGSAPNEKLQVFKSPTKLVISLDNLILILKQAKCTQGYEVFNNLLVASLVKVVVQLYYLYLE